MPDDGGIVAHPTYRLAGWHPEAPWWGPHVRRRVGMRHHPLPDLVNAFIGAGLAIEHVAAPGDRPIPANLAIRPESRAHRRLGSGLAVNERHDLREPGPVAVRGIDLDPGSIQRNPVERVMEPGVIRRIMRAGVRMRQP